VLPISSRNNRAHSAAVHRLAVESSGIGGGGPRERSPTVLAGYSHRRDRRGFHGLSHGYIASRRREESSGRSRCCSRRHSRRASRVRCWPLRRSGTPRPPPARLRAGTPSQFPAGRSPGGLPTVVRYGTPGFPETAKSWPANRGNLFAGGASGTAKLVQQTSVTTRPPPISA
jgi:hypothetical protein